MLCDNFCWSGTLWKMDEWIPMKFSRYGGHGTRNNQEHFGDVTFNPFNTFFSMEFMLVSNIMEICKNGFSS